MRKQRVSVAQYIEQMVALSDKPQTQIAKEVGYEKANMITMIKQGKTKLPLDKVELFARSLGIDPVHLLRMVLEEYMPETLNVLDGLIGKSLVTESELSLVRAVRDASRGIDLDYEESGILDGINDVISPIAVKELRDREGAAKSIRRSHPKH